MLNKYYIYIHICMGFVYHFQNMMNNWTELNWTELNWTELNWTDRVCIAWIAHEFRLQVLRKLGCNEAVHSVQLFNKFKKFSRSHFGFKCLGSLCAMKRPANMAWTNLGRPTWPNLGFRVEALGLRVYIGMAQQEYCHLSILQDWPFEGLGARIAVFLGK
jgi:hypothetical protein